MRIPGLGRQDRPKGSGARDLTITVTAGAETRPRQFQVSPGSLRAAAAAAVVGLIAILILVASYSRMAYNSHLSGELRAENHRLRGQLSSLMELEQRVHSLDRSRRSLLGVAGVVFPDSGYRQGDVPAGEPAAGGVAYRHARPDSFIAESEVEEIRKVIRDLPLEGPVTRVFGPAGVGQFHTGIDVAGDTGAPIRAAAEGVVSFVGVDETFGLVLVIAHTSRLSTMYGHNFEVIVRVGDFVSAGQKVAEVGSTGQSSAPHLHLEVQWDGEAIDPALIFSDEMEAP